MSTAGFDAGDHRIGSTEQKRRMHELVDRRAPREQHDDPGEHALPWAAFEAALVHGAFGNAMSDQVADRRDAVRECTSKFGTTMPSACGHATHGDGRCGRRVGDSRSSRPGSLWKATFLQRGCMKVAFLQPPSRAPPPTPRMWDEDVTGWEVACHTPAMPHPSVIILDRRVG
jgi:hypothetical protein